ncbi:MAG: hypothetical protein ACR2IS_01640 [Nitrososphaeraceae archaeon]
MAIAFEDGTLGIHAPSLSIWVYIFLTAFSLVTVQSSAAQLIPLPPPSPSSNTIDQPNQAPNDNKAPVIQLLTTEIKAGKSVFKVRISDESGLQLGQIKYVHDGRIVTADLVKDQNDVYKALIDVQPPSRIIVIDAADQNGNVATVVKEYSILSGPDILKGIENFFSSIMGKS